MTLFADGACVSVLALMPVAVNLAERDNNQHVRAARIHHDKRLPARETQKKFSLGHAMLSSDKQFVLPMPNPTKDCASNA